MLFSAVMIWAWVYLDHEVANLYAVLYNLHWKCGNIWMWSYLETERNFSRFFSYVHVDSFNGVLDKSGCNQWRHVKFIQRNWQNLKYLHIWIFNFENVPCSDTNNEFWSKVNRSLYMTVKYKPSAVKNFEACVIVWSFDLGNGIKFLPSNSYTTAIYSQCRSVVCPLHCAVRSAYSTIQGRRNRGIFQGYVHTLYIWYLDVIF